MNEILMAFGLTVFAGMATGIGSVIAFTAKRTNYRFLSAATGFSAGVMLYVSFMEILPKSAAWLAGRYGETEGAWIAAASFFGGLIGMALVDALVPAADNPHETHSEAETAPLHDPAAPMPDFRPEVFRDGEKQEHRHAPKALLRTGVFTALAITIHNFPEGMATFLAALQDPALGVFIALAIALHNIPEGISVSVPIFYATGDRKKAFFYSFLSGLSEPLGAVIALLTMFVILGGGVFAVPAHVTGILFGGVAGVMVYISLDELLPTSRAYGKGHDSILGLMAGMALMAASLLLMR
ncbi:MAG TPA: zinc transporter ZupT [Smithellaceae bacterium]|nr:zinc transporter ZupT [Smithellaceae bacterium]